MKKIFLDTEFTGLHQNTNLISIALVAESGEEFYMEITDYNKQNDKEIEIFDWITENVLNNLFLDDTNTSYDLKKMYIKDNKEFLKPALSLWFNQFGTKKESIQIWADVPHYDWVLFCEIFGGAMNIPKQIHYICMDLATLLYIENIDIKKPRIDLLNKKEQNNLPKTFKQHNALYDTILIANIYKKMIKK